MLFPYSTVFSVTICLMIASTVYEIILKQKNIKPKPILMAFSVYTNGKKLFSVEKSKSPNVIHCINGIRSITLMWVMIGHSYAIQIILMNMAYLRATWLYNAYSMVIVYAYSSMDSFLFLGGFVVAWSALRELDKNNKLNLPKMYLHRYLRLTPILAITILLVVSLYRHVGTGPISNLVWKDFSELCHTNWWNALLHIQTFFDPLKIVRFIF